MKLYLHRNEPDGQLLGQRGAGKLFRDVKAELPQTEFASHAEARSAVFDYIERSCNRQRRHSRLGYHTPLVYEQNDALSHAK